MDGKSIAVLDDKLSVPNNPIIPFIEGDGIGSDIVPAMRKVLDTAVDKAYRAKRRLVWFEVYAGDKASQYYGARLPRETVDAIRRNRVAMKGPLTTPVGGGYRSLNATLRQELDLYACVRPISHIQGIPSPIREPQRVDMVVFRENTEDLYAGIEWAPDAEENERVRDFLNEQMGCSIQEKTGIGIKLISEFATKRICRKAISYALRHGCKSVTIMHKGNIMKHTEGSFRSWCYDVANCEFANETISESEVEQYNKNLSAKVVIKDRIADALFQEVLLRPDEHHTIIAPNLGGDYLSDALLAQVGGIGPSSNLGDTIAVFEAAHGTASMLAGTDTANPTSIILSGALMLEFIGWREAATMVRRGVEAAIARRVVTFDLASQLKDARYVGCSEFAEAIEDAIERDVNE